MSVDNFGSSRPNARTEIAFSADTQFTQRQGMQIATSHPVFALRSLQRVENSTLPIPTKAICNPT